MNQSNNPWQFFLDIPKAIKSLLSNKLIKKSPKEEPESSWDEKVIERKRKTQEAKKAWEERKKSSSSKQLEQVVELEGIGNKDNDLD